MRRALSRSLRFASICLMIMSMITLDQKIAELLNSWTIDGWPIGNFVLVVIALLLSLLLCGAVGLEREVRGRTAGLRTHLLVGVGSCVIMVVSIYGFPVYDGVKHDIARLAAQVISGVGFLGAGAIIYRNSSTKGLTTASTIWLSMAIGLACGSMNFILAIVATLMILLILVGLRRFEKRIATLKPFIRLIVPVDTPVLSKVTEIAKKHGYEVTPISTERYADGEKEKIDFTFRIQSTKEAIDIEAISEEIRLATDAYSVEVLQPN